MKNNKGRRKNIFRHPGSHSIYQIQVHPTFLYESLWCFHFFDQAFLNHDLTFHKFLLFRMAEYKREVQKETDASGCGTAADLVGVNMEGAV